MNRKADIYWRDRLAGRLSETSGGYRFEYSPEYLCDGRAISFSLSLPDGPFESETLFPFFEGLLPEGWFLQIVAGTLKIDPDDKFGLLLATCADCVGAVGIRRVHDA